jgi:hypothetical protein
MLHLLRRAGFHPETDQQRRRLQLFLRRHGDRDPRRPAVRRGHAGLALRSRQFHRHGVRRPGGAGLSAFALRSGQPAAWPLCRRAIRNRHLVSADSQRHGRAERFARLDRADRIAARRNRLSRVRCAIRRTGKPDAVVREFPGVSGRRASHGLSPERVGMVGGWAMDSDRRSGPYLRLGFSVRY